MTTRLEPRKCERPNCQKVFRPDRSFRKYCSRACGGYAKVKQRGQRQIHHQQEFTKETGPSITKPLSDVPMCVCGLRMTPGTDWLGRTILECPRCGPQQVKLIGRRRHDQRERHEVELKQLISRGKTQIGRKVSPECGDAFRQHTHKRGSKGMAEFLGDAA